MSPSVSSSRPRQLGLFTPSLRELIRDPHLAIIDCETTGLDAERDRIIELTVQHGVHEPRVWTARFNPGVSISPWAQRVHGIRDEELAVELPFAERAEEIVELLRRSTAIIGYRVSFDLGMLRREFARLAYSSRLLARIPRVDVYWLVRGESPNTLSRVYERTFGKPHTEAHTSAGDVRVTGELLMEYALRIGGAVGSWRELSQLVGSLEAKWRKERLRMQTDLRITEAAVTEETGEERSPPE